MDSKDFEILVKSSNISRERKEMIWKEESLFSGERISEKEKVCKYLKSFDPKWITTGRVEDRIKKERIDICDHSYSDGIYEWSETDIYHFEKYNMPLKDEFIKHVLAVMNNCTK